MATTTTRKRVYLRIVAFLFFVAVSAAGVGIWLSQANADPPPEKKIIDVRDMSVKERTELGEKIIFGAVDASKTQGAVGKGQCPLCHGFQKGFVSQRSPNLYGITDRASIWIMDSRYRKGTLNTVQKEACPGCGNATSILEYIAESHICPSCYVISGFGVKGTNDRESPMPQIQKPPISLSIEELIAVDTWLYINDEKDPPSPQEIESAYRKFIPEAEWPMASRDPDIYPATEASSKQRFAPLSATPITGQEPINELFIKALCFACHTIPGIPGAVGVLGPKLTMKTNAPKRMRDRAYKGKATNVREYIIESIVDPSIYVVKNYPDNIMPKDYRSKLNDTVIDRMADYLSRLEEGKVPPTIP